MLVREDVVKDMGLSFMNIVGIFQQKVKMWSRVGEVLDWTRVKDEEVKWCTDTWLNSTCYYKDTDYL